MFNVVRIKRGGDVVTPGEAVAHAVLNDRKVWELAIKYDLRMAQIRGLISLYGNNRSKIAAAAKRLTVDE